MAQTILSKSQSESENLIYVRQSLVIKGEKGNILAVKLHNGSDSIINGVNLRVEFLDRAEGTVHETREVNVNGLMCLPDEDVILPDISVPSSRQAANVKIYAVTSGDYFYMLSPDGKSVQSKVRAGGNSAVGGAAQNSPGNAKKKISVIFAAFTAALFILALAIAFSGALIGGQSRADATTEIAAEMGE